MLQRNEASINLNVELVHFFPSLNNTDINSKNDGNKNGAANFLSGSEFPQDKNLIRNQNEKDTICQFHFSKDDQIFFLKEAESIYEQSYTESIRQIYQQNKL